MTEYTIKVHEIAVDGLPDKNDPTLTGRIAFIADGCIVSGWPILRGAHPEVDRLLDGVPYYWEGNDNVAHHRLHAGITHYVIFPVRLSEIENGGSAREGMRLRSLLDG